MARIALALILGLAVQADSTQRVPVAGGALAYDEAGRGPAVILLHGAFLDRGTWDLQMPALAARYRTVRYDIRPFGESTVPDKPYRTTDDLLALMDALKIERAHLVGHSFGGGVAIDFALEHPSRVASLALVNSGVTGASMPADEQKEAMQVFISARESEAEGRGRVAGAGAVVRLARAAGGDEVHRAHYRAERRTVPHGGASVCPDHTARDRPPRRDPCAHARGDRRSRHARQPRGSESLAKGIPGARLIVVPGADHAIPIGWAKELNDALLAFLAAR